MRFRGHMTSLVKVVLCTGEAIYFSYVPCPLCSSLALCCCIVPHFVSFPFVFVYLVLLDYVITLLNLLLVRQCCATCCLSQLTYSETHLDSHFLFQISKKNWAKTCKIVSP